MHDRPRHLEKEARLMATPQPSDADTAKIVELFGNEQREAAALSRYWDATLRGRVTEADEIDPELKAVVHLLRHYHSVTRLQHDPSVPLPPSYGGLLPPPVRRAHASVSLAALTLVGVFLFIFAVNTLLSPRSWLLSSAADPDWIPWVSDDWLGPDAVTAHLFDTELAELVGDRERSEHGA
jgi:hypothetical protein